MNNSINSLLGPLEAATRSGSWEDAEDIAEEIRRLAKLQRLSELQKIQAALVGKQGYMELKLPTSRIRQGLSTPVPSVHNHKTPLGPSWSEPWPFG